MRLKMILAHSKVLALVVICVLLSACGMYSFTGVALNPEIKTVTIKTFPNNAAQVQATLSQTFTEKLRNRFITQTNLALQSANGDLEYEGYIKEYSTAPISIQANDQAAKTRLTIVIHVKFTNKKDPKFNVEKDFKRFDDFSTSQQLVTVESQLIANITDLLVDDIFNQSVVNW